MYLPESLFILIFVSLFSCQDKRKTDEKDFRDNINRLAVTNNFSGAILVTFENRILLDTVRGFSDDAHIIPLNNETIFPIASVTKLFVRHAAFILMENGLLKIDDKLNKFFPYIQGSDKITVSDLIFHTSGLPDIHNEIPVFNDPWQLKEKVTQKDLTDKIISLGNLRFNPGGRISYSNSNYILLAGIIEKTSGMPLDSFLIRNIFRPCGLIKTGLYREHSKIKGHAMGFSTRNGNVEYVPDFNFMNFWGSGNAYSTTHDLLKYLACARNKLRDDYSSMLIQHSGYYTGYRTYLKSVPEIGFTLVILSNNGDCSLDPFINEVRRYISGQLDRSINFSTDSSMTGDYEANFLQMKITANIKMNKNRLFFNDVKTVATGNNIFILPANDFAVLKFKYSNGRYEFVLNDNGYLVRFVKKI